MIPEKKRTNTVQKKVKRGKVETLETAMIEDNLSDEDFVLDIGDDENKQSPDMKNILGYLN